MNKRLSTFAINHGVSVGSESLKLLESSEQSLTLEYKNPHWP